MRQSTTRVAFAVLLGLFLVGSANAELLMHVTGDAVDLDGTNYGDAVYDVRSGLNGTIQAGTAGEASGITNPAAVIGEGLDFPGSDASYVDFGADLNPGSDSLTIAFWFNADKTSGVQMLAGKGNGGSGDAGWSFFLESGVMNVRGHDSTDTTTRWGQRISGIAADTWYHLAMVIDRENDVVRGYLNGSNDGWVTGGGAGGIDTDQLLDGGTIVNTNPIYVGRRITTNAAFDGTIDDIQVYAQALTADEVKFLHDNPGAVVPEPSTFVLLGVGALVGLFVWRRKQV